MKTFKFKGFSLLEIFIALSITGFLFFSAIPAWHNFVVKNRVKIEVNKIVSALELARGAAILRDEVITFAKSIDQKTMCQNCNFHDGQIIFDTEKKILYSFPKSPLGDEISWRGSLGKNDTIQFLPSGKVSAQGSFIYQPKNKPEYSKSIVLNLKGRIYVKEKD